MTAEQEHALVKLVFDLANNPYLGHPSYKPDLLILAAFLRDKLEEQS